MSDFTSQPSTSALAETQAPLSKTAQKKLLRRQANEVNKQARRKAERERRKENKKRKREAMTESELKELEEMIEESKKARKSKEWNKTWVCVDLGFDEKMNEGVISL
jgi:hypothetical protein